MLGSGGAARAIAFALGTEAGIDRLTVLGIDDQERTALARDLQSKTGMTVQESPLDEGTLRKLLPDTHVLIHCTPMGMSPKVNETSVPADAYSMRD